jgi:hypothetical protein
MNKQHQYLDERVKCWLIWQVRGSIGLSVLT